MLKHSEAGHELMYVYFCRGTIDFEEMYAGCSKLEYSPPLTFSGEDWDSFTWQGTLVDKEGHMNVDQFEQAIRWQLALYAQRLLSHKMGQAVRVFHP